MIGKMEKDQDSNKVRFSLTELDLELGKQSRYRDKEGNVYLVLANRAGDKFRPFCINKNPRKNQRKVYGIKKLKFANTIEAAVKNLESYAKVHNLKEYRPGYYYKNLGIIPHCYSCECLCTNYLNRTEYFEYYDFVRNRLKKLKMRRKSMYCIHPLMRNIFGSPLKINQNPVRWYGFTPECPYNPYTHTCKHCGKRMHSKDRVHKQCEKRYWQSRQL